MWAIIDEYLNPNWYPIMIKNIWKKWLRFAEVFGTIQMTVILTIIYWVFVGIMALPFKLVADPLRLKAISRANWRKKSQEVDVLASMKNQY